MTKISIIAGTQNRLLDVLIKELEKNQINVHLIKQKKIDSRKKIFIWTRIFQQGIIDLIRIINTNPSITAYHFFNAKSFISAAALAILRLKYTIHFWGSDFHYWRNRNNIVLKIILKRAKFVTFSNSKLIEDAKVIFGDSINFKLLRFGLEAIDFIDDSKFNKITNKIKVVIGTNSQEGQQHLKIIEAVERLDKKTLESIVFIFPLNYGDTKNKDVIKKRLLKSEFEYKIVENYLTGEDLAKFRIQTDVLIQVQKTDAMSAAMIESIYAGAKVITGSWLPYDDLRKLGIDWVEIDDINEITHQLPLIIKKELNSNRNKKIISSLSRWSDVTPLWINCYLND